MPKDQWAPREIFVLSQTDDQVSRAGKPSAPMLVLVRPRHTLLWAQPNLARPRFFQKIWVSLPSWVEDKILLETNRFLGTLSLRKDFLGGLLELPVNQLRGRPQSRTWCPGYPEVA